MLQLLAPARSPAASRFGPLDAAGLPGAAEFLRVFAGKEEVGRALRAFTAEPALPSSERAPVLNWNLARLASSLAFRNRYNNLGRRVAGLVVPRVRLFSAGRGDWNKFVVRREQDLTAGHLTLRKVAIVALIRLYSAITTAAMSGALCGDPEYKTRALGGGQCC